MRRPLSAMRLGDIELFSELVGCNADNLSLSSLPSVPTEVRSETDGLGRSLLRIAVLENKLDFVDAILRSYSQFQKKILTHEVNMSDTESMYTVMHSAMLSGFLRVALRLLHHCPDIDLSLRCKEGFTCLDLLDLSINRPPLPSHEIFDSSPPLQMRYSTSVWTWGSNTNFQLGHTSTNNRINPERVDITTHQYVDEAEAVSLGSLNFHNPRITKLAMSKYHTVLSTNDGVFSFGFGAGGRLGQGHEETVLLPRMMRTVDEEILKDEVECIAAGPDHTIIVFKTGQVFSCGCNKWGQLGYATDMTGDTMQASLLLKEVSCGALKKVKVVGAAASKYHSAVFSNTGLLFVWGWNVGQMGVQGPPTQLTPRKVTSIPYCGIVEISATNNATAILTNRGEIFVLANHDIKRISIESNVVKIISGNHQFAGVTEKGSVFLWSSPSIDEEFKSSWQQVNFPQSKPVCIWAPQSDVLKAIDVAIGIDSTILVVTKFGHVYSGSRRKDGNFKESTESKKLKFFKFMRVPCLNNIRNVAASISGSFAALRYDVLPMTASLSPCSLFNDLRDMTGLFIDVKLIIKFESVEYCFTAHRVVLSARSSFFRRMFEESMTKRQESNHVTGDAYVVSDSAYSQNHYVQTFTVRFFSEYSPYAFSSALELLYYGEYQKKDWNVLPPGNAEPQSSSFLKNQSDFVNLLRLLDIPVSAGRLDRDFFSSCLTEDFFRTLSDIVLELADGERIFCHGYFLAARSPFFRAMLEGYPTESRWNLRRRHIESNLNVTRTVVVADLSHLSKEVMEIVMRWMYTDGNFDSLAGKLSRPSLAEYLSLLVDVLAAADELLLDRLKDQTSAVLQDLTAIWNVLEMLEIADTYHSSNLMQSCLDFSALTAVSEHLVLAVEEHLKQLQEQRSPGLRGRNGYYSRIRGLVENALSERHNIRQNAIGQRSRSLDNQDTVKSRAHLDAERAKNRSRRGLLTLTADIDDSLNKTEEIFHIELEPRTAQKKKVKVWKRFEESADEGFPEGPGKTASHPFPDSNPWEAKIAKDESSRVSLSEIMKAESSKSTVKKTSVVVRSCEGTPTANNTLTSSPSRSVPKPVFFTSPGPGTSPNSLKRMQSEPVVSLPAPVTIPIRTTTKKSQKERKRELLSASSSPATLTAAAETSQPKSSPWNIPEAKTTAHHKFEDIIENFWGEESPPIISPRPFGSPQSNKAWGGVLSSSPSLRCFYDREDNKTSPASTKVLQNSREKTNECVLPAARPSFTEIVEEEMVKRRNELIMRENIKKTSLAEIQRQEQERKELKEEFGIEMILRNGEWVIEMESLERMGSSLNISESDARTSATQKKRQSKSRNRLQVAGGKKH
ncbi:hypothetical protein HDU84_009637 [Entophlyctis sp. JEL0112]|nr:hypothetical protein HDU84_009637 [Entophlyctis sp. JEL0112]